MPKKLHDAIKLGSTSLLMNMIDNYGKMGYLSDFEYDLLNNSIESIS